MRKKNAEGTLNSYVLAPHEVEGNDRVGWKVVAVAYDWGNWWCAFRGPTDWPDKKVADEGDEIDKTAAEMLFPSMANTGRYYGH
jgi:hypothetical protein